MSINGNDKREAEENRDGERKESEAEIKHLSFQKRNHFRKNSSHWLLTQSYHTLQAQFPGLWWARLLPNKGNSIPKRNPKGEKLGFIERGMPLAKRKSVPLDCLGPWPLPFLLSLAPSPPCPKPPNNFSSRFFFKSGRLISTSSLCCQREQPASIDCQWAFAQWSEASSLLGQTGFICPRSRLHTGARCDHGWERNWNGPMARSN